MACLFFAIFFALTSVGQYLFVKHQMKVTVQKQLDDWAKELNEAVDYKNGVDLKAYNQAFISVADFFTVLSNGAVLEISSTSRGLIPGLIPEVTCPLLSEAAYSRPVKATYTILEGSPEQWWIYAKKIDQGIVVLGISELDQVEFPERMLKDNITAFGTTLEEAQHVNSKVLGNAIGAWAVIADNGQLVGGFGRIPLQTDPMAMGRIALGDYEKNVNGKSYLVLYSPLHDAAGKAVGTVVISHEITFELEALQSQGLFNAAAGGISFLLFVIFAVFYSSKHEKAKRAIKEAFQHYFSPQILEAILREPELLKLGGQRREVTILFSDIRSFTSLSEKIRLSSLLISCKNISRL